MVCGVVVELAFAHRKSPVGPGVSDGGLAMMGSIKSHLCDLDLALHLLGSKKLHGLSECKFGVRINLQRT